MEIKRVNVFVHWSLLLIGTLILLGAVENPLLSFTVLVSYYGVILLHDCGHIFAALRRGCEVFSIELYPIWGITQFTLPFSAFDQCVIAWGGVAAQALVAVPLIGCAELLGYSRFEPVSAILAIWGFFSLSMAIFNLLPIQPLDGATAWRLLPALVKRSPGAEVRRERGWRSWR